MEPQKGKGSPDFQPQLVRGSQDGLFDTTTRTSEMIDYLPNMYETAHKVGSYSLWSTIKYLLANAKFPLQ